MTEPATYSITEIVGTSQEGVDDAIRNGIATASKTLRNLDWFEVTEIRGFIGESETPPEYFPGDDEARVPLRRLNPAFAAPATKTAPLRVRFDC